MSLFNIFRKKKTDSTFPENELEISFMKSAEDAEARKEFYQKLLWSQLFVLINENQENKETGAAPESTATVGIAAFETGHIPVFTSINRIFDQNIIKEDVTYMSIKGMDLFGATKGASFVLNPNSKIGKELSPEEIESIMDGTIYEKVDAYEKDGKKHEDFQKIYDKAIKKQDGLILLDGYHHKTLTVSDMMRLDDSVKDFKKCLEIIPDHWPSMVLMAKALQRLERHAEALEQLEKAFKIELTNASIPLEASLEAMHLHDIDKALYYSAESLKRSPDNFALLGNHAMNLLIAQRDDEAKLTIDKAIQLKPDDQINKNVKSIIKGVLSGRRPRPGFDDVIR